jgi:hypothetical protein
MGCCLGFYDVDEGWEKRKGYVRNTRETTLMTDKLYDMCVRFVVEGGMGFHGQ